MELLCSLSILLLLFLSSTSTTTTAAAVLTSSPATNSTTPSPPTTSTSTLDPKQLRALQSLNIPTSKDPCTQPSFHNATTCDNSTPFRHLTSLRLSNCSDDTSLSVTALKSLSTLTSLAFLNCPINPIHFPSTLTSNLRSFTSVNSLKKLTGVWLSRLQNVTDLTISGVIINASGPSIILSNLRFLRSLSISNTTLSGYLPKHWKNLNLTHIDLSNNNLKGKIPASLTLLENLQTINLSSNHLTGEIPTSFGHLLSLQNLSLSSNSLSGPPPASMAAMSELIHLDLGSNQFNGTIPNFITEMKGLKYLNLEKNNFHGVMPFNASFIKKLEVFKIGGNDNLCYNHTTISSKVKLGIAPCDKHGMPVPPPPAKDPGEVGSSDGGGGSSGDDGDDSLDDSSGADDDVEKKQEQRTRGPSKVILGVAIGLSSIVFLIVFLVLLSKWCG